jgi:hypothetical protein
VMCNGRDAAPLPLNEALQRRPRNGGSSAASSSWTEPTLRYMGNVTFRDGTTVLHGRVRTSGTRSFGPTT